MTHHDAVLICSGCGRGFLRMPPGGVDVWPIWGWTEIRKADGMCAGRIEAINRASATRMAANWEIDDVQDTK